MRGRFVTFEGIDGSGKSTALAAVAQALDRKGLRVWRTAEETAHYGQAIRASIEAHADPLVTAFLFLADRAAHVPEIESHLAGGRHVLCDRFMHSTMAYQGATLADRFPDAAAFLRSLHASWCPVPDRVVLFTADPGTCVARTQGRASASRYEKAAFLESVQAQYLALAEAEPELFVIVDADQDAATVQAAALEAVRAALGVPP